MADSSIAITAGSGISVDTRTEATNSEHRQVIVVGDPSANAGVAAVLNVAPAATDYGVVVRGAGNFTAVGAAADGAAVSGNPVLVAGQDGVNVQSFLTDTSGRVAVIGAAADGAAAAGNPILIAGQDGTNVQSLLTDTSGRQLVVGAVADGAAVAGNPVLVAGQDGANVQSLRTSTDGRLEVVGDLAHGVVDAGNPQKIGGIADDSLPTAVDDLDRVNAWFDRHGRQHVRAGHQSAASNVWTAIHVPAANTQATVSKAAAGVGIRNVVTALTATIAATATAPTAVNVTVNLIDGATGGTTYLWRMTLSLPAVAGETRGVQKNNCWLPGTANTATTLEFSAAGGANTIESVSMEGITITE